MTALRPRILIVDDELQIHRFLRPALKAAGYEPVFAETAAGGLREIAGSPPDAVVLDLGLPDMDGKNVLQTARAFYSGPIIILSARDREREKIDALDMGADDYVEKPFGVGELLARLRVAMRHRLIRGEAPELLEIGDVSLDLVNRLVTRAGARVRLSPKEYELLAKLAEANGKVMTHKQLLTAIWGPAHVEDVQYLRVFVGQLRQKLESDPASPRMIMTEPGVGYRFCIP